MKKTNRRSKQSSPIDASASDPNEKQVYEERIRELERENKAYQIEIAELRQKHGNHSSASNNGVEKLKEEYLQKLNLLEEQVTELKKKLGTQSQFSTQRKRVDESTRQLQFEIQSLKAQKVQLQCKIKLESVQFRLCKALLEKEVLQLKKEGRRNEIKTQSLLASNERLKMVLQRKTEEASAATKRLGDMIAARKAISHRSAGARNRNGQLIQDAEHELEVTSQLHKLCSQYESKMEKMAEEIVQLKEEIEMHRQGNSRSQVQEEDCDGLKKDFDIQDLKEQINSLGCLFGELQSRKEKVDFKDKKQVWAVDIELEDLGHSPLLSEESDDKIKMVTPEVSSVSENNTKKVRTAEGLCCSCSKKSLCKTTKCICRSSGGSCGASCGCTRFKCTNREPNQLAENESLKSDNTECSTDASAADKDGNTIASECAKLLQSALVQKPASCRDNPGPIKKPLCDIQNSLGNLDDQRLGKKKKVQKPVIRLVTTDPMSSSPEHSSSTETYKIETQGNNPMRLDRVTKPAIESHSSQPNELATSISDAAGFRLLRNSTRLAKSFVGKEDRFI
ncbi:kinesin-like protein KIN-4C [Abrus precatorius]|uniref:Kinesin-like protein KIN-4C n=1 Tax=Abrus precatorius TaxID=3816 RepID=A0A8B8LKR6_ABRPR|nr:kinesin-like protein KIN-4C [Abrus precatorius]